MMFINATGNRLKRVFFLLSVLLAMIIHFESSCAPGTGSAGNTSFTPPPAGPFLDYDCIGTGYGFVESVNTGDIYIPKVVIDEGNIMWASPNGGGDGSSEDNPTTLENAISSADSGCTVIALDGEYFPRITLWTTAYVNIISKNRYGARINTNGNGFSDQAIHFGNDSDIHHLNIIGFEVYGGGMFIESSSTVAGVEPHHIYISDCLMHDLDTAIYSGLHSHDWTIDRCVYYSSNREYLMYAMGWHHALINSVMYNNSWFSYSIRGHYPVDEFFNYKGNNPRISERTSSYLDEDDWTHKIINNTFASNQDMSNPGDGHLVLYYNADEGEGASEDSYFPPQNVTVANNVFVDNGPLAKNGFIVFAERGINTGAVDSVDGIYVMNNVTDRPQLVIGQGVESIRNEQANTCNATQFGFADAGAGNFMLTAASSALVDMGIQVESGPNSSTNGKARDAHPDVGAYELSR